MVFLFKAKRRLQYRMRLRRLRFGFKVTGDYVVSHMKRKDIRQETRLHLRLRETTLLFQGQASSPIQKGDYGDYALCSTLRRLPFEMWRKTTDTRLRLRLRETTLSFSRSSVVSSTEMRLRRLRFGFKVTGDYVASHMKRSDRRQRPDYA